MPLKEIIQGFRNVEKPIMSLIWAVFFIQLIDASFFMLFNYYLRSLDYSDSKIAMVTAFRYMAIMVLAFPLGIYIKGRRLKPFFKIAALALPVTTLFVIYAVEKHIDWAVMAGMVLFGVFRLLIQVAGMPFIILNSRRETHSEAIALYFQTFSVSIFISGMLNFCLSSIAPDFFTEKFVLQLVAALGFIGFFFVRQIRVEEKTAAKTAFKNVLSSYDWGRIFYVLIPTFLIAIGAGFTIPFINLFFQSVHGVDARAFSLFGAFSFVLVTVMLIFIPYIQRRYGYKTVLVTFQGLAIVALFVMASTEWYKNLSIAMPIAVTAYLLRQPFMNVAMPATSELSIYYVGERNQEIMSALQAAIWSGSWFVSSLIFGWMRSLEISYANIFMITVVLYIVATQWYVFLINAYNKELKKTV